MSYLFNKTPILTNNEPLKDIFYAFPIGILIIEKENNFFQTTHIVFANKYIRDLFNISKDDISHLMTKLNTYKEYNNPFDKKSMTLQEILFQSNSIKDKDKGGVFISPLQQLIHIKIKRHHQKLLLIVDDLQEERRMLQSKFVKSIGYEYLLTLYHEINNPLNSLIASVHEIMQKVQSLSVLSQRIDLLVYLIQFFLKNFIVYFQVAIIDKNEVSNADSNANGNANEHNNHDDNIIKKQTKGSNNTTFNIDTLLKQTTKKYETLFNYKKIKARNNNFSFLNNKSTTMNYFYFKTLIKSIFGYFYHKIDKGGHFFVSVEKIDNSKLKLVFTNAKNCESLTRSFSSHSENERKKESASNYNPKQKNNNTIQTIEMMINVINKLASLLNLQFEHFESDTTFISLIIPYETQSKIIKEEDMAEFMPGQGNLCHKMKKLSPKFSMQDLNCHYIKGIRFDDNEEGDAMEGEEGNKRRNDEREMMIHKRNTMKPLITQLKSKTKDIMKSLLRNIDKFDSKETDNSKEDYTIAYEYDYDDYHKLNQSMQEVNNNYLVIDTHDDDNDDDSHNHNKKKKEYNDHKRKKNYTFSKNSFEILSPTYKKLIQRTNTIDYNSDNNTNNEQSQPVFKLPLDYDNDIIEAENDHDYGNDNDSLDKESEYDHLRVFSNIRSSIINNRPRMVGPKHSIKFIKDSTSTALMTTSIANNPNFIIQHHNSPNNHNISFQKIIQERILKPPTKKQNTGSLQSFYTKDDKTCTSNSHRNAHKNSIFPKDSAYININSFHCDCNDVLVVDDEQFNISCLTNLLNTFHINADVASNGKECLEQITLKKNKRCFCNKASYKLILMDILMPKLDGIETAKEIIRRVKNGIISNNIAIIFISACHDKEGIVEEMNNNGSIVKEFISKPIKRLQIQELIQKYYKYDHQ